MSVALSQSAYSIVDLLTNTTEDSSDSRVYIRQPGDLAREQLIAEKLGVNGWGRWQYFRNFFSGAWGDRGQRPFSPRSQDMLFRALERIEFPDAVRPSLFLTDEGHCELAWRDDEGGAIQLGFGPREFEVYLESAGIEETHPNADLETVLARYF